MAPQFKLILSSSGTLSTKQFEVRAERGVHMSNTNKNTVGIRDRKRSRFDASRPKSSGNRSALVVGVIAAVIVIASAYFLMRGGDSVASIDRGSASPSTAAPRTASARGGPSGASVASATPIASDGDVFRLPANSITTEATFFTTDANGTTVPLFAVRDGSGRVHVALDACQVCARAKKGYVQAGDDMQCRNCGMTFAIAQITEMGGKGGCHPISLPSSASGEAVLVKQSDVAAGVRWF
jgi:hypothetical protein